MLPPLVISCAASRVRATSEYALISCETRNASRVVLTKSPSSASRGANASECSIKSTRSVSFRTLSKNALILSSLLLAEWNDEIRMPNNEGSPNDRMTKAQPQNFGPFGLRHSFDIRHFKTAEHVRLLPRGNVYVSAHACDRNYRWNLHWQKHIL